MSADWLIQKRQLSLAGPLGLTDQLEEGGQPRLRQNGGLGSSLCLGLGFHGTQIKETHLVGELHLSVQGPGWTWPAWVAWDSSCEGHSGSLLLVGELGKWHVTRKSGSELFTLPDS